MEITDVRVKPISDSSERLKAVCTVTFDDSFVVRDVKVVDGVNGLFVAMPSRKMTASCPDCNHKNAVRARYCNNCGLRLPEQDLENYEDEGRSKLHRDIAHPITSDFRAIIQQKVIDAYMALEETPRASNDENEDRPMREPDEYSTIIAGLKGGRGRAEDRGTTSRQSERRGSQGRGSRREGRSGTQSSSGRTTESREGNDRQPEGDGDRQRRGGRRRGGSGRRRDQRTTQEQVPERETTEPAESQPETMPSVNLEEAGRETEEFGRDILVDEAVSQKRNVVDQVSVEKEAEKPPAEENLNEDSAPFGTGLL